MIKNKFGIVQGRLIQSPNGILQWFPQEFWEHEFFVASSLGFNYIELIAERKYNENNPIWTAEGIDRILALTQRNGLFLNVICDDYVIDHSMIDDNDVFTQVELIISQASLLGINKLVLPLFEKSELTENNFNDFKNVLHELGNIAESKNILVCLETLLDGKKLLRFIEYLDHPNIKCVFDTGNRAALGQDICADIIMLREYIQHVHIKDKNERNENVLLGTGLVNFQTALKALYQINYSGDYTFETLRGNDPAATAKYHKMFLDFFLMEARKIEN
ncbi:MAG: sugar phosphate isomerase/epimerase family protein [Parachlamydiaceae bacterium]|nr:sugar phosphate isomerase/epimerase family protein [Parachlamydiaceae bacterium]